MSRKAPTVPRSSGLGGVLKSLTKSLKPASGNVPVVINPKVVGGGKDMQRLLLLLQHGTLPSRASAAQEVTEQLEKYAISSIPEVWYLARDLCDYKLQSSIRRVVLKLMIQCIKQDEDAVSNKLMFFRDIVLYCKVSDHLLDPEFDLFLKALRSLTNDGREIHDLYIYELDDSWGVFVIRCLTAASRHAKDYSGIESTNDRNFYNLIKLLDYLTNCLKFNSSLMEEHMLESLLSLCLRITSQTNNSEILIHCIEFIKACINYGYIPTNLMERTVEFLCWSSTMSENLDDLSWAALRTLCLEYPSPVVNAICSVLHDPSLQQGLSRHTSVLEEKQTNENFNSPLASAIGAIAMLERVFVCIRSDKQCQEYFGDDLLEALQRCLDLNHPIVNSGFLRMFDKLFDSQNYENYDVKDTLFSVLFPFLFWYSSSTSMFQILSAMKLSSDQDASYWTSICLSLFKHYKNFELVAPKERLVLIFMKHPRSISQDIIDFILLFYKEDQSCSVLDTLWKANCRKLLNSFYYGSASDASILVRKECLRTIKSGFEVSMSLSDDYNVSKEIILEIILKSVTESDQEMVDFIMEEFIFHFLKVSSIVFTRAILTTITPFFHVKQKKERIKSIVSLGSFGSGSQLPRLAGSIHSTSDSSEVVPVANTEYLNALAKALSKAVVTVHSKDAAKANEIYQFIIEMVQFCLKLEHNQTVLILLRLLVRLRSTSEGFIYFVDPKDVEGLATTFKRNKLDKTFEGKDAWWSYPEQLDYIPSENLNQASRGWHVFNLEDSKLSVGAITSLDISSWFDIVVAILEDYFHWELYTYTWTHFCSQLSNMRLFEGQTTHIRRYQKLLCDQLTLNLPRLLLISKTLPITKADMQVAYIRNISSLIGYHELFRKNEEDQIVSSLLFALDSWERTAIPCIHMLTVCCYEIPISLKKYLTAILTRLQTGVTSAFASSPSLEFLMSLIQVPSLTSNFTMDEFKRVFAIAFKYIQYASDVKFRKTANSNEQQSLLLGHGVDAEVDRQASTQATEITPIVNEYLLAVSYLVISKWFLKINVTDRRQVSGFLIKNIVLSSTNDGKALDDRAVAFLDLVARFTFCDIPLQITAVAKQTVQSPHSMLNRWIVGHSIVSIETDTITGHSIVSLRRPTGTSIFQVTLDPAMLPTAFSTSDLQPKVMSSYFLLQLLLPLNENNKSKPIALFDDTAVERAISTFDRIPVVSHHKAGILYIGPNQKTEVEILGNTVGSPAYHKFLDGIGELVRLNDNLSYAGGLDKESGTDGEFAYVLSDQLTQLVYHTTTLMPNTVNDRLYAMKKRHIGNNHINVFFDESGLLFNFNVIKSQFNFINIVICPHSVKVTPERSQPAEFYKVRTYRRSGVPGIFSSTHFKLISLDQLLDYIRTMVLMADRFAHVWHYTIDGNYTGNWALRVKHISTLKQKTLESHRNLQAEQERQEISKPTGAGEASGAYMTQSFLQQLQAPSAAPTAVSMGTSKYDYISPTENELYSLLEFNSFT